MKSQTPKAIAEHHWQKFIDTPRATIAGTPVFLFPEWVKELIEAAVKDGVEQAIAIAVSYMPEDPKMPAPKVPGLVAGKIRDRMMESHETSKEE